MNHVENSSIFTGQGLPNLFGASLDQAGENTAQIALQIDKEQMSASATIDEYESELQEAFPDAKIFMETIIQGPPASAPVTVEFYEEDLNILDAAVGGLTDLLENEEIIFKYWKFCKHFSTVSISRHLKKMTYRFHK